MSQTATPSSTAPVPEDPTDVPGIVALHLRATEALVHAWDVAVATEQQLVVDDALPANRSMTVLELATGGGIVTVTSSR